MLAIRRIAMTLTRSALFAALLATAAFGCRRDDPTATYVPPAAAPATTEPAEVQTETTRIETYQPEATGTGTAAPSGGGALGGAAVQGRTGQMRTRSGTIQTNPNLPNSNTNPADPSPNQNDPADPDDINSNTTTGERGSPADQAPEPGTSDTSTQSTRPVPDSQDQGIGGGDTYDRNR
jgi:hypothetical protein